MKKPVVKILKIAGITLSVIILLLVLAAGSVLWVLSDSGLKKTTAYAIENYSPCRIDVGGIHLSLVKTFPYVGLCLDDVTAYNAVSFTPSDTLAHFDKFTVQIDFDSYRNERLVKVEKIYLDGMAAWLYTDSCGNSNLDMFGNGTDSTDVKEREPFTIPDTLGAGLSFNLDRLEISNANLKYTDLSKAMSAQASGLGLVVSGNLSPDVNGKTDISLETNGISGNLGESATSFNIGSLNIGGKAEINGRSVTSDGNVCISSVGMTSGEMSASCSGKTDIGFNLTGNLNEKYADGTINIRNDGFTFNSATADASAGRSVISLELDGNYGIMDLINAAINGEFANLAVSTRGESPISLKSDDISLNAVCALNGADISAVPSATSPSLTLKAGDEAYIKGWPVSISLPVQTDTLFKSFKLTDAAISVNGQTLNADADCNLLKNNVIDTKASVKCEDLCIATIMSMLPSSVSSSLEGIKADGLLSMAIDGSATIKNEGVDFGKAAITLSTDQLYGNVNDSISANIGKMSVTVHYPGSSSTEDLTADFAANDIHADIIADKPITASVSDAGIGMSFKNVIKPDEKERNILANVHLKGVDAATDSISAQLGDISMTAGYILSEKEELNNKLKLALNYDTLSAELKGFGIRTGAVKLSADAKLDTTRQEILLRWKPVLSADVRHASIDSMEVPLSIPSITFDYSLGEFRISDSYVLFGNSDLAISGNVRDIDAFVDKSGNMEGTLNLVSNHTDMDELLRFINGYGRDDAGDAVAAAKDTTAMDPFLVPERMDMTFNTVIKDMDFNRHKFYNLGGDITIKDGTLVLQELGFSSDAARMQLTAIYETPEPDNLYASLNFHLLDIDIHELIDLIPSVDTVVPMLKSFDGKAQFHLAVETDFYRDYSPKIPTLIGAAAIEAQNLKVMDNEVFESIKKKLLMSKKAENRIDSLSVELQVMRDRVDLFPFLIHMDRYSAVIAGRHNLNDSYDCKYHISVTDTPLPIRLGVDIEGSVADIAAEPMKHIKLTKCKYDKTFDPKRNDIIDQRILEMKSTILNTLKSTVK